MVKGTVFAPGRLLMRGMAHNAKNLSGKTFGRLTVLAYVGVEQFESGVKGTWLCRCQCGKTLRIIGNSLTTGNTTSCGCASIDALVERSTKHGAAKRGGSRSMAYRIWQAMLNRCRNQRVPNYADYGGRGITVCERWQESFQNFIADMGEPPPGTSIDRRENDGNYEPANCRWATRAQQARNKRSNRIITYGRKSMCLKDWANSLGIDQASLYERLKKWPLKMALTTPKKGSAPMLGSRGKSVERFSPPSSSVRGGPAAAGTTKEAA